MKELYTMQQWQIDREFKAEAGQEISAEIYEEMLNALPPYSLPRDKAAQALENYNIPVHAGFLMGEPHSCDNNGRALYLAFGMNDYGKGKHYYYLGLSVREKLLEGEYYFFDCLNAFITDRYFKLSAFKDEQEAIATAANYEAVLYKCTFKAGVIQERVTVYDPYRIFEN